MTDQPTRADGGSPGHDSSAPYLGLTVDVDMFLAHFASAESGSFAQAHFFRPGSV